MGDSVDESFLNADQRCSLIELVTVAATALSEVLRDTFSVYRDLRRALALLVAEIKNIELLQDALWRKELFRGLTDVANAFNEVLNGDYLKWNYQEALHERSAKNSILPSWLTVSRARAQNSVHDWASPIYPNLYMLHELVRSSLGRSDMRTRSLLKDDDELVPNLTECLALWNDLVDRAYAYQVIEYEEAVLGNRQGKPFIDATGFCDGASFRNLAATNAMIILESWDTAPVQNFILTLLGAQNLQIHFTTASSFCWWAQIFYKNADYVSILTVCLVDPAESCSVCLHLVQDKNYKLWDQSLGGPLETLETFQPDEDYMELKLGKVLKMVRPTYAAKRVLGTILARSLLHLIEGPWVNRWLDIDDISIFCRIENQRPYPLFDKVFLSTVFKTDGAQGGDRTAQRNRYSVHPFPVILALGIILAEIELGDDLCDLYSNPEIEKLKSRPYQLAPRLLRECSLRFGESGLLRAARFCVDRTSFLQFVNANHEELVANKDFVTTYYTKAVRPLEEDLVKGAKWSKDEVNRLRRNGSGHDVVCKVITEIKDGNLEKIVEQKGEPHRMTADVCKPLSEKGALLARTRSLSSVSEFSNSSDSAEDILQTHQKQRPAFDETSTRYPSATTVPSRPTCRDGFEVAIICALPLEANAVLYLFDQLWDEDTYTYGKEANDPNSYSVGVLGGRNVVLAHPPRMGRTASASVAAFCALSFKKIKLALVVGVCGGVPFNKSDKEEILLGDVVISKGVIQYDFGRQFSDQFRRKIDVEHLLGRPNDRICSLLAKLETIVHRAILQRKTSQFLSKTEHAAASYPGDEEDKLYRSSYRHKHQDSQVCPICAACKQHTDSVCDLARTSTCEDLGCDDTQLVRRRRRNRLNSPVVHMGLIASGDSVVKSEMHRDQVAAETNVIAFEMEGGGVWDTFPCVIIKGVCDYADSHKNKRWQEYAAATAAACAKAFIQQW
ncbi:purine and uridine phosphorylase [Aspergillus terreus]|uniref:Purine and uridine phosphorylase n=1 Tax=Aspergillus terreus TaxID=33178 RepID=A0A5M3YYH9_ASPTE|nr:hypothetical protein ATETN484_0004048600 [Aspergillus terreus]GFF13375.1 purine and uridine phosphorylase [Aspergillus terreus]